MSGRALIVDEDGRLLFHNARLRDIVGYRKDELDLSTRARTGTISISARALSSGYGAQGGQILNERVVWRTKTGNLVHLLLSYVQVAYQGGHISFVGGKRVLWVYDVTALTQQRGPRRRAGAPTPRDSGFQPRRLCVVDEEGRLLFHNGRLRELTGYKRKSWSSSRRRDFGPISSIAIA